MLRRLLALLALTTALAGCGDDASGPKEDVPALGDRNAQTERETGASTEDDNSADDLLTGPTGEPEAADEQRPRGERGERRRGDDKDDAGAAPPDDPGAEPGAGEGEREGEGERDAGPDSDRRGGSPQRPASRSAEQEVERARESLRSLVDGIAQGDPSVCTERMTPAYVERITKLSGAEAIAKCRRDVASARVDTELEVFGPSEIKGDRAVIRARVRIGDRHPAQIYDMRRDRRDRWRVHQRLQ